MRTIGVGLIGTGYMGKCHALAWTGVRAAFGDAPVVRRVMLCEVEEDLARRRADEFGFESSTADWRALIADPAVEVVSITTPNALHAPMAIAALEAGKHVWCEKPMATSLADARRMADAAKASGRVTVLGYNYIQNPMVRQIDALLDAGTIGRVNHVRVEMDEDFMADPNAPFGFKSEKASGYGALDDFGVHPLSLITTLLGPVARVMCHQSKPYATRCFRWSPSAAPDPISTASCSRLRRAIPPRQCRRPSARRTCSSTWWAASSARNGRDTTGHWY